MLCLQWRTGHMAGRLGIKTGCLSGDKNAKLSPKKTLACCHLSLPWLVFKMQSAAVCLFDEELDSVVQLSGAVALKTSSHVHLQIFLPRLGIENLQQLDVIQKWRVIVRVTVRFSVQAVWSSQVPQLIFCSRESATRIHHHFQIISLCWQLSYSPWLKIWPSPEPKTWLVLGLG